MEQESTGNGSVSKSHSGTAEKRNAFTELMSSHPKQPKQNTTNPNSASLRKPYFGGRDGLGAYIANPEAYPPNVVIYHNADFVAIYDMFPKSSLHLLLLPRDKTKYLLHPFEAFKDEEFLAKVKFEAQKLRSLAAGELRRKYGKYSALEQERQNALNADPPPDELPRGRDWDVEVMCGIHAVPSMNHLHVHVIAVDRYSDRLKSRNHYNSFATPFFVPIDDFPLSQDDPRISPTSSHYYLNQDFVCWRCGRNFGNKFTELKKHLEEEFVQWRQL
ncbi:uncharacterized protein N7469_007319 [Penicillium citrinum]|uniref:Aprataxin-like protein n=1 Tax=Penicillium citrinum TaxID=5077 RepID=A0A9W9TLP7_PENCI|nr:uncharacterized protein N7469_007319 [Penicillium citrinum]KAJ5227313.1 hypothetical protein N7469_007319 [Penicillium citrinum]